MPPHEHTHHADARDQSHPHDRHDIDGAGHGHAHGLSGGHAHAPATFGKAFAFGIALNAGFVLVEAAYGLLAGSMSLLADAGHNLSDVLGLLVAFAASWLVRRRATARFTYGFKGSSILAALFNAVFLLVIVGGLSWEALIRLVSPEPVAGKIVMAVAAIGIAVNGITAWLFASGRDRDINIRGAYLHMLSDAVVSVGVVAAGFLVFLTGWLWIDPVSSLVINVVIVVGTFALLRDSTALAIQGVPGGIDAAAVAEYLANSPGVAQCHDLHIWAMSTTETAMTAHLVMPDGHPGDDFLRDLGDVLDRRFGIVHATVQIEVDAALCRLAAGDTCAPAVGGAA